MQTQQILDPNQYPTGPEARMQKAGAQKGGPIPLDKLSKEARQVFARFDAYVKALGRKPEAVYLFPKQATAIEKGLRRISDELRATDFTYRGLPIEVYTQ